MLYSIFQIYLNDGIESLVKWFNYTNLASSEDEDVHCPNTLPKGSEQAKVIKEEEEETVWTILKNALHTVKVL